MCERKRVIKKEEEKKAHPCENIWPFEYAGE